MPVHDWTRVSAGSFHDLHLSWIAELRRALNGGILPEGYYALAEQVAGGPIPDVLTLQELGGPGVSEELDIDPERRAGGGVVLADAPPGTRIVESIAEATILALRRRRIVIRHTTGDRVIALIEIVSPGNKSSTGAVRSVVEKAVAAIQQGYHLLLIDLCPQSTFDPRGLHDRIWRELDGGDYTPPPGDPLTLVSYRVDKGVTAYVEPTAVGKILPAMPLFLDAERYVNVPLEATYMAAYEGVPNRWKRVIEADTTS